jgi:hypothetical protein
MSTSKNTKLSVDLEINGVTTGIWMSTGILPMTGGIASLNSRINLETCENPRQVENLNPVGQISQ